jgi:hypothetical protein
MRETRKRSIVVGRNLLVAADQHHLNVASPS